MVNTIRGKNTLLLMVSMLSLLFVVLAPVMGEEQSDLIAEKPELAPLLAVTLSPGETAGSTSATVTGHDYGGLVVNITEEEIPTPYVGDPVPTAGDNLTVLFVFPLTKTNQGSSATCWKYQAFACLISPL